MAAAAKAKAEKKTKGAPVPAGLTSEEHRSHLLKDILDETGGAPLATSGLSIHIPGVIPTGDPWLDLALGRGGWPLSRIVMVSGNEGSGKTTLALQACARVQKAGGIAIYFDSEYKLDLGYAKALGVDVDSLILYQSKHIEAMMSTIEKILAMAKKHREMGNIVPIIVVVDSLNATPAKIEVEAEFDELRPGAQARAWSAGLRKLNPLVSGERANLFLVSQVRKDFNVEFGDDEATGGGKAPRFYAAVIVSMTVTAQLKDGKGKRYGNRVHVRVSKNQVAPPFQECHFQVRFGHGVDDIYGLHMGMGVQDVVEQAGSWFTVRDLKHAGKPVKYNGQEALRTLIVEEDGEVFDVLEAKLRASYPAMGM